MQELTYESLDEALADTLERISRAQSLTDTDSVLAAELAIVRQVVEAVRIELANSFIATQGDGDAVHRIGSSPPLLAPLLTPREQQVLHLMAAGLRNKEIAAELGITERTAAFHVGNVMAKLGTDGRVEAINLARRYGWLVPLEPA
jgi:DNA-binding NarL/FixJ family response regulator